VKLIANTKSLQSKERVKIQKKINYVSTIFTISLLIPVLAFLLFYFKLIPSKGLSYPDIESAVARITTGSKGGTAFLVSPTIMLTARHVVEDLPIGAEVSIFFEKSPSQLQVTGKVLYYIPNPDSASSSKNITYFLSDFAVIEIPETDEIIPLSLGDSDGVQNLAEVILVGYPIGDYSITIGNINSDSYQGQDLFKLDATSNPGNSGGPCILKEDFSVIGILVGGSAVADQGENVALKINNVLDFLSGTSVSLD